jgi:putative ABC transport system substrate-binding protein
MVGNQRPSSIRMKKNILLVPGALLILALVSVLWAQQPAKKVWKIGYLSPLSPVTESSRRDGFIQGLRELGYIEGQNIVLEYRYAQGNRSRFFELAAEIVDLNPDVIVVGSNSFTAAAKQATRAIPIVAAGGDLVGERLVANVRRPGENVTGSSSIAPEFSGTRLKLLKEAVPGISRVAVLWFPRPNSSDEKEVQETESAGREIGIEVKAVPVRDPDAFTTVFTTMKRENVNGVVVIQGAFTLFHRKQLVDLLVKNRLPSMCETADWTDGGCLISYGPDPSYRYYRLAFMVDKILKGAKPGDLPLEKPTKFDLVINVKTANRIGLTISQNALARADKVIR